MVHSNPFRDFLGDCGFIAKFPISRGSDIMETEMRVNLKQKPSKVNIYHAS